MSVQRYQTSKGVRYRVRYRDESGTMKSRSFNKKSDAARFERDTLAALERGAYIDPRAGRQTVSEFGLKWIATQPWRDSTRDRMLTVLEREVVPRFGSRQLTSVRRSEVQAWVGDMSQRLAPRTVVSYYRVLVALYRAAVEDDLLLRTPCRGITLPRLLSTSRSLVPITADEVRAVVSQIPAHYQALVWAQASLGLRTGEVTGITVDRVNWLRRTVTIDRQLITPASGAPSFGAPKTPASNRTLEMSPWLVEKMAEHLLVFGEGDDGLVFHTRSGAAVRRAHWASEFKKAATAAGVSARPHDLRHFAASLLIDRGVSVKAVQGFMGHATAAETLDTYGHLWPDDRGRIAEIFNAEFSGMCHERAIDAV